MKSPSETTLVRACLDYLRLKGIFAWRCNSGAVTGVHKGRKRYVQFNGMPGMSDIVGVMQDGRFLAVECKMPGQHPTETQASFLRAVNGMGGLAIVARSLQDLEDAIIAHNLLREQARERTVRR